MSLSSDLPEDLKPISAFLKRAEELDGRDPVMAYYCRYHFVTLGLAKRTPQNKAVLGPYLMRMLDKLEADKAANAEANPAIADTALGKEYVLSFASKVFLKADNEDRAGNATQKTARSFLVAVTFLEVLNHFGAVDEEIEKRIKYAKWKAADIIKAEREGRRPVPGPPGGDDAAAPADLDGPGDASGGSGGALPPRSTAASFDAPPGHQQPTPGPQPPAAGNSSYYGPVPGTAHAPPPSPYAQGPPSATPGYTPAAAGGNPPYAAPSNYGPPPANPYAQPPASPYTSSHPPAAAAAAFDGPADPAPARAPPHGGFTYLPTGPTASVAAPRQPPPAASQAPLLPARPAPASASTLDGTSSYDPAVLNNAQKYARYVISSLQYEDVPAAIDNLEKALALLRSAARH